MMLHTTQTQRRQLTDYTVETVYEMTDTDIMCRVPR